MGYTEKYFVEVNVMGESSPKLGVTIQLYGKKRDRSNSTGSSWMTMSAKKVKISKDERYDTSLRDNTVTAKGYNLYLEEDDVNDPGYANTAELSFTEHNCENLEKLLVSQEKIKEQIKRQRSTSVSKNEDTGLFKFCHRVDFHPKHNVECRAICINANNSENNKDKLEEHISICMNGNLVNISGNNLIAYINGINGGYIELDGSTSNYTENILLKVSTSYELLFPGLMSNHVMVSSLIHANISDRNAYRFYYSDISFDSNFNNQFEKLFNQENPSVYDFNEIKIDLTNEKYKGNAAFCMFTIIEEFNLTNISNIMNDYPEKNRNIALVAFYHLYKSVINHAMMEAIIVMDCNINNTITKIALYELIKAFIKIKEISPEFIHHVILKVKDDMNYYISILRKLNVNHAKINSFQEFYLNTINVLTKGTSMLKTFPIILVK